MDVPRRAVAADADADSARRAPFSLRVPYRVQDAFAHAFKVAIRAPEVWQLHGHRVLRVHVFAAPTLQDQLDLDVVALPLIEVDDRRAGPEIVTGVLTSNRIDRVRPQLAALGCLRDRLANLLAHLDLVRTDRHMDLEGRHAGVLADGAFTVLGKVDVL